MELKQKITIKNPFSCKGRIKRGAIWCWLFICWILFGIILGISMAGSMVWFSIFQIIPIWLFFAAAVRRLHDHNLSGNWFFFLTPVGIALMYMAYILDLDDSVIPVTEKIKKTSSLLGWAFAAIAWFFVAPVVFFCLLLLCTGKHEDNMFGPNPY